MKIIFLDFDGVLNDDIEYCVKQEWQGIKWGYNWIHPHLVERLNEIIEATGAEVVVSSTWREQWDTHQLQQILLEQGFKGKVIGRTPEFDKYPEAFYKDRSDEILQWMMDFRQTNMTAPPIKYVAIDDRKDLFQNTPGMKAVFTNEKIGLSAADVEKAISILNE